jgi:hypothetical protein
VLSRGLAPTDSVTKILSRWGTETSLGILGKIGPVAAGPTLTVEDPMRRPRTMRWLSHVPAAPKRRELVLLGLAWNIVVAVLAWFLVDKFF